MDSLAPKQPAFRVQNYSDDLISNLTVKPVDNPSYICNQFNINQCKNLTDEKYRSRCESAWLKICPNFAKNEEEKHTNSPGN